MKGVKRLPGFILILTALAWGLCATAPAWAASADDPTWTIYCRPSVRFGTGDRTILSFDFLVPLYQGDKNILFFNPRYNRDDSGGYEANLGLGYRHLVFSDRAVLGLNAYYDTRRTGWDTHHDQWGIGAEVMTEWVTGRMNGYFAVTKPQMSEPGDLDSTYTFRDVGLYLSGGHIEETLSGIDGEVGFKVPCLSKYIETWVYAGGYHFEGKYVKPVDGFVSRVEVIPTDFLRLNFEYRNDTVNQDEYYGEVAVALPFSIEKLTKGKNPFGGISARFGGDRTLKERMVEPVRRDVDVQVGVIGDRFDAPELWTKLEDVVFVSENADNIPGTPNGTFEHPYASINEAMTDPGSAVVTSGVTTIHVMNDDSGLGTAGGGLVNLAHMMIWGSGMPHPSFGFITNQRPGNPIIDSTLTLGGNDDEAFGMILTAADGIISGGAGTRIHHNVFLNNTNGITITGGSASITDNTFTNGRYGIFVEGPGNAHLIGSNAITITGTGSVAGVYFENTDADTTISANTIKILNAGGDAGGIVFDACTTVTGEITGNTIGVNNSGIMTSGIGVFSGTGDVDLGITNNTILIPNAGGAAGGIVLRTSGNIAADIGAGNSIEITDAVDSVYGIDLLSSAGDINAAITDSDVTVSSAGEWTYGIQANAADYLHAAITGTSVKAEDIGAVPIAERGISLEAHGTGMDLDISGSDIAVTGAAGYAFGIDLSSPNGYIDAAIEDTDISALSIDWIAYGIRGSADGYLRASITGGSIDATDSEAYGVYLFGHTSMDLTVSGATIEATGSDSDTHGIFLGTDGSMDMRITDTDVDVLAGGNGWAYGIWGDSRNTTHAAITGGTVNATGYGGTGISLTGWPTALDFDISGTTIRASGTSTDGSGSTMAQGVGLLLNGGSVDATITNTNLAVSAASGWAHGISGFAADHLLASVSGSTVNATGDGVRGIFFEAYGTGINATITGTGIVAAGSADDAYGIELLAPAGDIDATITDSDVTVSSAGEWTYGIQANAADYLHAVITGTSVKAEGIGAVPIAERGISLEAHGTGMDMDISGSDIAVTSATGYAFGIDLSSPNGYIDAAIEDTDISALSIDWIAYGIRGSADGYLRASITGGSIDATDSEAYGVYLFGHTSMDLTVSGATIEATGSDSDTHGIFLGTDGSMDMRITDTDVDVLAGGNGWAYGIRGDSRNTTHAAITGGTVNATGYGGTGISLTGWPTALDFDISGTTIRAAGTSTDGSGSTMAQGVGLLLNGGSVDATITNTNLAVSAASGWAHGVSGFAADHLLASLSGSTVNATGDGVRGIFFEAYGTGMNATITGTDIIATGTAGDAYGIYLKTSSTILGTMNDNIANITSTLARYFMYLESGSTTGNSVDWSGNTYTPYGGAWSGNYPASNGPLQTNFTTGITP